MKARQNEHERYNFFDICTKEICHQTTTLNTRVQVDLPQGLVGTLVVLPAIQTLGLKPQNGHLMQGTQTLTFRL